MRSLYQSVKMSRAVKRLEMGKKEEGFTLIELMIVVLIIAILVAVAVPTFLGARKSAQRSAAAQLLRNAISAGDVIYTAGDGFGVGSSAQQATALASFKANEPSIAWNLPTNGPTASASVPNQVGAYLGTGDNATGIIQSIEYVVATSGGECEFALDIKAPQSSVLTSPPSGVTKPGVYYALTPAKAGVCEIVSFDSVPTGATTWSSTPVAS